MPLNKSAILAIDIVLACVIIAVAIVLCFVLSVQKPTTKYNSISLDEYRKIACTGDVIIFSNQGPELRVALQVSFKNVVEIISQSPWTHVGMTVIFPNEDEIYMYESNFQNYQAKLVDKFTGLPKTQGPQLVSLKEKLRDYKGTTCAR